MSRSSSYFPTVTAAQQQFLADLAAEHPGRVDVYRVNGRLTFAADAETLRDYLYHQLLAFIHQQHALERIFLSPSAEVSHDR